MLIHPLVAQLSPARLAAVAPEEGGDKRIGRP